MRRPQHPASRFTLAWRWAVFLGSLAIVYFSVGQLLSAGDVALPLQQPHEDPVTLTEASAAGDMERMLEQRHSQQHQKEQQEQQRERQHQEVQQEQQQQEAGTGEMTCHAEENAEYEGDLVNWGHAEFEVTAEGCCDKCRRDARCNVWVWCGREGGCGEGLPAHECWLKHLVADPPDLSHPPGRRGPDVPWTSGAVYVDGQREAAEARVAAENAAERQRLADLKANPRLPLVYMDVSIKGEPVGRMEFVLFADEAPRAAENYRQLFTGEKGTVPEGHEGAGRLYHLKGTSFYRIIDRFIDQGGADTDSVFGGSFKDDPGGLKLKHDRKGLLSIANAGPDTNDSHFSIMMGPEPHNDGHYTVFGELVEGWDVAWRVNQLSVGKPKNEAGREEGAVITDSGQLRRGDPIQLPDDVLPRAPGAGGDAEAGA